MQTIAGSTLALWALVCASSVAAAQTPIGALAIDEQQGDPVWLGGGLRDGGRRSGERVGGVRHGLLGGADVPTLRGLRGGSGRGQHGSGLGGIVWLVGRGSTGGALGMQLAWRHGLPRSGVGLQRAGGRGGSGPRPGGASADSAGSSGGGLRPWRCGRLVGASDAVSDSALVDISGFSCDGLSGWDVGGGASGVDPGSADVPPAAADRC